MNRQYTAEQDVDGFNGKAGSWTIMDPDGDWICSVPNEYQAQALLSHLNKG